jgi:hypothetical protein
VGELCRHRGQHLLTPFIFLRDLPHSPFDRGTFHAVIFSYFYGISVCAQIDYLIAFCASRRLELGWIFEFFKVVFVCPIVDIHFGFEVIPAFLAGLPIARMSLIEMMTAQRITVMIARATISGIGE